VLLGSGAAWLAGCQSAPSAPAAAQPSPGAQPTGGPASLAELVEAARPEGKVVLFGPPGAETRTELPRAFERRYGIQLEYLSGRLGDMASRLLGERAARLYTMDVAVGGAQTQATVMWDGGMHDPIRPILVDPSVTDPTKWATGKLWFLDPQEQYILRISRFVSGLLAVNTEHVALSDIRQARDLLHPRWRGKIITDDPRTAGTGSNNAAMLYAVFGEGFLRQFYVDQKVVFTREERQSADWLARGTYPIQYPANPRYVQPLIEQGFPIEVNQSFEDFPGQLSSGSGVVALINRAPHPNAARLFVNWLASPEGLEVYSRTQRTPSNRVDLDESWASVSERPKPGVEYFDTYEWEFTAQTKPKVTRLIEELIPV
jgi:ABC-type Fe3+ transport system substrate-binding protein